VPASKAAVVRLNLIARPLNSGVDAVENIDFCASDFLTALSGEVLWPLIPVVDRLPLHSSHYLPPIVP
jgi:hypothetical protein